MFEDRNKSYQSNCEKRIDTESTIRVKPQRISVIVPVFNEEKLVGQALSVFTPELKEKHNIELIVSDGGSSDRTVAIASQYADIVVVHTADVRQTISQGRNRGADKATGDVLVFVNGDCLIVDPDTFFGRIRDWMGNGPELPACDAIACRVSVKPGEIIFKDKVFYFIHNNYVRLLNFLKLGMGRGECQIIKTETFHRVGGYDDDIAAGEDFDLYRRIAKVGKIKFTKKLLVYESPRRFRKYGYLRIIWSWTLNSLSVMFRGKSVSKVWEAVR